LSERAFLGNPFGGEVAKVYQDVNESGYELALKMPVT